MPATFKIAPGPLYRFDGITVSGTEASDHRSFKSDYDVSKAKSMIPR